MGKQGIINAKCEIFRYLIKQSCPRINNEYRSEEFVKKLSQPNFPSHIINKEIEQNSTNTFKT